MGNTSRTVGNMTFKIFLISLCLLIKYIASNFEENNCEGLSLSECSITPDKILETGSESPAECQLKCSSNDMCVYWRHDGSSCHLLNSEYYLDCDVISGPITADVPGCLGGAYSTTCEAILQDTCEYSGEETVLEAAPGLISDVVECEVYCEGMQEYGFDVAAFAYNDRQQFCRVYNSGYMASCSGIGAPSTAPDLGSC